jgi:hypothetical protein
VPDHPSPGCFDDFAPLGTGDGFEWTAKCHPPARLHFYKGNEVAPPRDDVDLDPANAKPVRHDIPATTLEVSDRLFFGRESKTMARITPLFRIAVDAARHVRTYNGALAAIHLFYALRGVFPRQVLAARICTLGTHQFIEFFQSDQDISRFRSIGGSQHACQLELIDDTRRAAIADTHAALQ